MIVQNAVDNIVTITLNRPEKANALTESMLESLVAALDGVADSPACAVILTGAGRVFSAGADLDEARAGLVALPIWDRLAARLATMPCLTIAAINGAMAGGAFGLALGCDIRICVPEARFFYPVMRLGIQPPQADPRRLAALIGVSRAKMLLMAGAVLDAAEARDWGLVDRIIPAPRLYAAAAELAADAQGATPEHVMMLKAMLGAAA
ncbi:MAG: enoyl-CoA hydratase/isomerase family protein [Paracoccus sp. (in: a-proteobacteria)]|nr:enoyl-CoA hydratase/isomerase family protein [Paracoccus sp. (in: a-proteobacteria)]